jgi:chorismate-pyruvate lyase
MTASHFKVILASIAVLISAAALRAEEAAKPPAAWPDNALGRVEVLALLQTLNADLLSNDSATLTLDRWCDRHKLAPAAHVVAERVRGADLPPSAEQRQLLGVSAGEPIRYRRVRLHCGNRVLSEADNWYVPSRLTPAMNQALDTTDIAFGRAVQALHFRRQRLSAKLLWSPLPEGWEMGAPMAEPESGTLQIPPQLIEHHAVLMLPDGTPFSEVVETYRSEVLAFPAPALR